MIRTGATITAVAGIVLLAGCSPTTNAEGPDGDAAPAHADGTYTSEGTYNTPESVETISVTVTLESDVITDVQVEGDPQKSESEEYQGQFIGGISEVVVGKDIDEIQVSRVAGSSLTSGGFNEAIEAIKAEAAL
jgi:hypothetical protein